jgi:cytochrome c
MRPFLESSPAILLATALLGAGPVLADDTPDGAKVFNRNCAVCHSINPGQNIVGPSLAGVVGRKAGQIDGFDYSEANRKSGLTWDVATLDTYLTNPRGLVPGTKMSFPGLKDPADRAAVIAYLKNHSIVGMVGQP